MSSFSIRKPISAWNRPLQADFPSLFRSLAKFGVSGASHDWSRAAKEGIDAVSAVGLTNEPGDRAWLLIHRALVKALFLLVQEQAPRFGDPSELKIEALEALEETEVHIHGGLFERPAELPLLEVLQEPFREWLIGAGLEESRARAVAARLPRYFVFGLAEEWQRRFKDYAPIEEALTTPFSSEITSQFQWERYAAFLEKQVEEPVFDEGFSLQQIYIPLRAYWIETEKGEHHVPIEQRRVKRHVFALEKHLGTWLTQGHSNDTIKILSGGPGSGKSSCAKMFAARVAAQGQRVVFVPLQYFEATDNLLDALAEFAGNDPFLPTQPIDPKSNVQTLLILDGLDELALQGRIARENAQKFVRQVVRTVDQLNRGGRLRLRALITGRELVIQEAQEEVQRRNVLHLLPYSVTSANERQFDDPDELLAVDHRNDWWQRFGALTGKDYPGLPKELQGGQLDEITAQPLLNYLVALSFVRDKIEFSAETNLNTVYGDLLAAVYERGWEGYKYRQLEGFGQERFERLLEEVALAAWHGNTRTTTVAAVEEQCRGTTLLEGLTALEEGAKSGVTRLLTAFYFRQSGRESTSGERTFEFTHKSFGEYLAARRITRFLGTLAKQFEMRETDADLGWGERQALGTWLKVCGPQTLEADLYRFIQNECRLRGAEVCSTWQNALVRLINYFLVHSWPLEEIAPRPSFLKEQQLARNAGSALLAVLNACSNITQEISQVEWPERTSFGDWVCQLQGQRSSGENAVFMSCLQLLDLNRQILFFGDLYSADLSKSDLASAAGLGAMLFSASLRGADLQHAILRLANLQDANLQDANLQGADLHDANLRLADLQGADLQGADLQGADLQGADLQGANLQGADLRGAGLQSAKLQHAELQDADLQNAKLQLADLRGADLRNANLQYAELQDADLQGANLQGAKLPPDTMPP